MATPRKPVVDPLIEELPPADEPKPESATDVNFVVEISPYVVSARTFFRWEIVENTYKSYTGDYVGHRDSGYYTTVEAEAGAADYIQRVRQAVELKLSVPDSYRITL